MKIRIEGIETFWRENGLIEKVRKNAFVAVSAHHFFEDG